MVFSTRLADRFFYHAFVIVETNACQNASAGPNA